MAQVDRGGHASWSQEKALVTGLQAARAAAAVLPKVPPGEGGGEGGGEAGGEGGGEGAPARMRSVKRLSAADLEPLEVEPTEPHVQAARALNRATNGLARGPLDALRSVLPVRDGW